MHLEERAPLGARTTLGVGGPARWLVEAESEAEVVEALAFARDRGLATLVLGGGSNLLVADRGFDGLVLRPLLRGVEARAEGSVILVDAGAGERWDDLVAHAVARGWAGVECLSGIPGDVGATPIQNVGAYGQEVADTIRRVRAVDRASGAVVTIDAAACGFGYRDSAFKRADRDRYVITSVTFALRAGGAPALRYAELTKALAGRDAPTLAAVRDVVIALRRGKSMVLDAADENGRSAGSFFVNPTVSAAEADRVASLFAAPMPRYAAGEGLVKLSAGWLIEQSGFVKGTRDGAVGLSTKHALAVVNRGGATAAQIVAFASKVRAGVRARSGVTITPEPVLVGFAAEEIAALVG